MFCVIIKFLWSGRRGGGALVLLLYFRGGSIILGRLKFRRNIIIGICFKLTFNVSNNFGFFFE